MSVVWEESETDSHHGGPSGNFHRYEELVQCIMTELDAQAVSALTMGYAIGIPWF